MQLGMALHRTADSAELPLGAIWRSIEINFHHFQNYTRKKNLKLVSDGVRLSKENTFGKSFRKMTHLERR